jgi:hypothetical protein
VGPGSMVSSDPAGELIGVLTVSQMPTRSDTPEPPSFELDRSDQTAEDERASREASPSPPLFELEHFGQTVEGQPIAEQSPPSPPLPLPQDHEFQAQGELREQFQWLSDMLNENKKKGWGTGYRDFVDVLLLLRAVGGLGMVAELGNKRVHDGVFHASTGGYSISLSMFIRLMGLEYSPGTWRNKLTSYFRLRTLHSFSEHANGIRFRSQEHQAVWDIVRQWMENDNTFLPATWVTIQYGNSKLQGILREMEQEVRLGKRFSSSSFLCVQHWVLTKFARYSGVRGGTRRMRRILYSEKSTTNCSNDSKCDLTTYSEGFNPNGSTGKHTS